MKTAFLVSAKLPHTGLGNMLLVWARAATFAEINSLPMTAPNWKSFHIGPWLRREKCKRYYGSFFSTQDYQTRWKSLVEGFGLKKYTHSNPALDKIDFSSNQFSFPGEHRFLFSKMPPWNDYFQDLKNYQPFVKQKLYADIRQDLLSKILNTPCPLIGIHIRRGDYQPPQPGDDFTIRRNVYTPLAWYAGVLTRIREEVGKDIPAIVFSDGYPEELLDILQLPNVSLSLESSALSDLITMSRSKLLIGSSHSSFSSWASYLGQCPTIWHSERYNLYEPIFSEEVKKVVYEGGLDPFSDQPIPDLLKSNLSDLYT